MNQAYDLGLSKKYKMAGDGSITEPTNLPAQGKKVDGFVAINRYIPVFQGPLDTPAHHKFYDEAKKRLIKIDPSGPAPDKYVQSNYEALNAMKIAMEKSKFDGRNDTMKLIEALEGLEVKQGDDFPQGDKTLRKDDHQAFLQRIHLRGEGRDLQASRDSAEGQDSCSAGVSLPRGVSGRGPDDRNALPGEQPGSGVGSHSQDRVVDCPLRRTVGAQPGQFRGRPRRGPRHHRTERRRQEHLLQLPDRRVAAVLRPHRLQRRGRHRPAAEHDLEKRRRALVSDHQHHAQRLGAGERPHRRAIAPARLELAARPQELSGHQREGAGRARFGRPS